MTDVLLIIDVQNAILEGTAAPNRVQKVQSYFNEIVSRLPSLKSLARAQNIQTILIQNDGPQGHRLETGTTGWEIVPALAANEDDIVIHKESCDSFHETTLKDRLDELGATRLIVGGCMTQFCVDTTIRRAVSLGFEVVLISDGHCTGDAGDLHQGQIIAHHNQTLDGFSAGQNKVQVLPVTQLLRKRD